MSGDFSTFSGVMGIASGIQIIDKLGELCKLLSQIQQIPKELESQAAELRVISSQLNKLRRFRGLPGFGLNKIDLDSDASDFCESILQDLHGIYSKAEEALAISRAGRPQAVYTWNTLKATQLKKEVSQLLPRLHRALDLFGGNVTLDALGAILSSSSCFPAHARELGLARTGGQSQEPTNPGDKCLVIEQPTCVWSGSQFNLLFGRLSIAQAQPRALEGEDDATDESLDRTCWKLDLQIARWLGGRGWRARFDQINHGIANKITSYNVRDENSPLFVACKWGTVETVQALFTKRQASPFDITPKGRSALHVRSSCLVIFCLLIDGRSPRERRSQISAACSSDKDSMAI